MKLGTVLKVNPSKLSVSNGEKPSLGWQQFRLDTKGSLLVDQFMLCQKPFMADFNVPLAEFRFIEMPARYRSFEPASDVRQIVGGVPQSSPSFHLD